MKLTPLTFSTLVNPARCTIVVFIVVLVSSNLYHTIRITIKGCYEAKLSFECSSNGGCVNKRKVCILFPLFCAIGDSILSQPLYIHYSEHIYSPLIQFSGFWKIGNELCTAIGLGTLCSWSNAL